MQTSDREERFGDDARFFVVLADSKNRDESWKLKRDFDFVYQQMDRFLNTEGVSEEDEIQFTYRRRPYVTFAKVLLIVR